MAGGQLSVKQCNTCGGTYVDVLPDGTRYFHACPPLAKWEIDQLIAAGQSPLTKAQQQQLATLQAIPAPLVVPQNYIAPADAYLGTIAVERPNKRDENVDPVKVAAAPKDAAGNLLRSVTDESLMKSVGLGAVDLVDVAL
jgi:hypothetical protein